MECGLAEREAAQVAELSYPDKRRVEMARALATGANLILLDEPAAGMTAEEIAQLADEIVLLKERGYTIVVIEHHMDLITSVCDRVVVLNYGEKIAEGKPEETPRIQKSFRHILAALSGPSDGSAPSLSLMEGALNPAPSAAAKESAVSILTADNGTGSKSETAP